MRNPASAIHILFFLARLSTKGGEKISFVSVSIVTNHQLFRELNISDSTGALFFLTTVDSRFLSPCSN